MHSLGRGTLLVWVLVLLGLGGLGAGGLGGWGAGGGGVVSVWVIQNLQAFVFHFPHWGMESTPPTLRFGNPSWQRLQVKHRRRRRGRDRGLEAAPASRGTTVPPSWTRNMFRCRLWADDVDSVLLQPQTSPYPEVPCFLLGARSPA